MVFFAAQSEEGFGFIPRSKAFACDSCFAVGYYCNALLVLVEFVALGFHGEDGSKRELLLEWVVVLRTGSSGKRCLLILRRDFAPIDSHDDMTYNFEGLVDDFGLLGFENSPPTCIPIKLEPERSGVARLS